MKFWEHAQQNPDLYLSDEEYLKVFKHPRSAEISSLINNNKGKPMNEVTADNVAVAKVAAPEAAKPEVKFVQNEKEVGHAGAPKAATPADVK